MVARARRRWTWFGSIGPVLILADVLAVVFAGLVVETSAAPLLGATVAAVLVAGAADVYHPGLVPAVVEDLPGLFVAAVAAAVVLVAWAGVAMAAGLLVLACLVLAHTLVLAGTRGLRGMGGLRRRVLVVGTGGVARQLALTLITRPELGLRPVGFVGTGSTDPLDQARGLPLPLLGRILDLPRAMGESRADGVVVALSGPAGAEVSAAIEWLAPADVYAVSDSFPPARVRRRELVGGLPVVHLRRRATWPPLRILRRLVEVLGSAVALAALVVPFLLLALLVRIETGEVLVRNPALGFRTRRSRSVGRRGTTFSVAISGRMGPVGRLLRRTGLVVLPELVVVLLRRVRYAGGVPAGTPASAAAPSADEAQVHAGQLAR